MRTGTDTITGHTASVHHGTGADITVRIIHITVRTGALIGAVGATVHGDTTDTTTHGITADSMTHGTTTHGIMAVTMEDIMEVITPVIGDGTTLGITTIIITAGMIHTITTRHTSAAQRITRTDITA